MTLARRIDGVLWLGGVWCEGCGRDTFISQNTHRCAQGHDSDYRPIGTRVMSADDGEATVERLHEVIASAAVAWICRNCGASFSLPLEMACDDHRPVAKVVFGG